MSDKHSKEPWETCGDGHSIADPAHGEDRSDMMDWCSSIDCYAPFTENEDGGYERVETQTVAKAYGRTLEEAQANARRIVQCVNAHDELVEALKEMRRAIGDHHAPEDCYATGPLTGDLIRDLVQCPACSAIAMYDAAITKTDGSQS